MPSYPGIEVKADGGYVVAPPSLDVNGVRYRFASNSGLLLPVLPESLYDLIRPDPQANPRGIEGRKNTIDTESPPDIDGEGKAMLVDPLVGEKPPENGKAREGEPDRAEKSDRDCSTSQGAAKPRLLLEYCDPHRTVHALRNILAAAGGLFDRGVPVRLVPDPRRGTVAKVITPDALV